MTTPGISVFCPLEYSKAVVNVALKPKIRDSSRRKVFRLEYISAQAWLIQSNSAGRKSLGHHTITLNRSTRAIDGNLSLNVERRLPLFSRSLPKRSRHTSSSNSARRGVSLGTPKWTRLSRRSRTSMMVNSRKFSAQTIMLLSLEKSIWTCISSSRS